MIYLTGKATVTINNVVIPYFSEIEVKNNCQNIGASCTISIPLTVRYPNKTDKTNPENSQGQALIDINQQTFNFIKGMQVKIVAWYEEYKDSVGKLTEFEGFIYDWVAGMPLKIRCLDYFFFFRLGTMNITNFNGSFKSLLNIIIAEVNKNIKQMRDVEKSIPTDTKDVVLSKYFLDFEVINFTNKNLSPAGHLEYLKNELSAVCTMLGNELYFGLSSNTIEKVNLDTRYNVIGTPKMQLPAAAFQKFKMQAYYQKDDGTKRVYASGNYFEEGDNKGELIPGDPNGELHEISLHIVQNKGKDHQKLIDNALMEKRLGHYSGTLETLLYPKLDLFYLVNYNDYRFSERNGKFVVREHTLKINKDGYKRSVRLAYLSA